MLPTIMEMTIAVNSSLQLNQIVSLVKGTGSKLSEHVYWKGNSGANASNCFNIYSTSFLSILLRINLSFPYGLRLNFFVVFTFIGLMSQL